MEKFDNIDLNKYQASASEIRVANLKMIKCEKDLEQQMKLAASRLKDCQSKDKQLA